MSEQPKQLATAGSWKPGHTANPLSTHSPAIRLQKRIGDWLEHKSVDYIRTMVANKDLWGQLPAIDAMLCRRIHAAIGPHSDAKDLTVLLDYWCGKPSNVPLVQIGATNTINVYAIENLEQNEREALRGVLTKLLNKQEIERPKTAQQMVIDANAITVESKSDVIIQTDIALNSEPIAGTK